MANDEIPRRCRVDKMDPAELSIMKAIDIIEAMGADERLTDAVQLLSEAKDKVSDFIDNE